MNPGQRKHPVYATPRPLVSFAVRSVHLLLQSRFGLRDGLADRGVRVLDPAAGDMRFVIEAWRVALDHVRDSAGERGLGKLVSGHLLPHFHGIELLAEACAESRRAVGEFFSQLGLPLDPGQGVSLRRADALSAPRIDLSGGLPVVLGNPPWSGYRTHQGEWIRGLLRGYVRPDGSWEEGYYRMDGKRLAERNVKWLQDDYVKFLRFAQWTIDHLGKGIAALVVNHTCLEAHTFRGLRQSLVRTFNEIYALDLHGNRRKGERTPGGEKDDNVFPGVSQGAAVLFLVKDGGFRQKVFQADLHGGREEKLASLESSDLVKMNWKQLPTSVPWAFRAARCGVEVDREYHRGTPLPEIFPVFSSGVITGGDAKTVTFDREEGRREPFLVRPFDRRFLGSSPGAARPREAVMKHLRRPGNVALLALRQAGSLGSVAFVTPCTAGHKVLSGYFPNVVFPLYLFSAEGEPVANLSPAYCETLGSLLGFMPSPEEILGYVYAVLYHPAFGARYRSQLWDDFPRIPPPGSVELFRRQSGLGRKLVQLHLLEDVASASLRFEGDLSVALGKSCSFDGRCLRLNESLWVEGVDPEVWIYRIGGYQVLERWLRARAGRQLTRPAREDLARLVEALRSTVALQREIGRGGD